MKSATDMALSRRALIATLALAGCARSPEPSYYTVASVPGTPQGGAPARILLRRVGIPGYLDRSSVVRVNYGTRLDIAANDLWAGPLDEMIGRVLSEDLTQRLPGSNVFLSSGAVTANPDVTVEVNLQRLDGEPAGGVVLSAQVAIERGESHTPVAARTIRLTAPAAGMTTSDIVHGMSNALGQLADAIAGMLREVPAGRGGVRR